MLKNKIIVKKIRNIFILLMAIIIMLGAYHNIRNSKAENVIQVELEVADKSNILSAQTITVDATETSDGNYLINLPISVNKNIVTKYYTSSGEEIEVNVENNLATVQLTDEEVKNKKVQLQTDYDTKEVTDTKSGEKKLLYKRLLTNEPVTEEHDETSKSNEATQSNSATKNETTTQKETEKQSENKNTTQSSQNTDNKENEENQDVIATGYMPIDAKMEVKEIDLATLTSVKIPDEKQTMQKAYEVSIYQMVEKKKDESNTESNSANTNSDEANAGKAQTNPDSTLKSETEGANKTTDVNTETNTNLAVDSETQNVEMERVEYDPSIYEEKVTIITKNEQVNVITTIYALEKDNKVAKVESTTDNTKNETRFETEKTGETVKYVIATEEIPADVDNTTDDDANVSDDGINNSADDVTSDNSTTNDGDANDDIATFSSNNPINTPVWKIENVKMDKINKKVTADLIATDERLTSVENSTLTTDDITITVDGDANANNVITKTLGTPTFSANENGLKEIKYTLTLDNWEEAARQAGKSFLEYSGSTKIEIKEGTIKEGMLIGDFVDYDAGTWTSSEINSIQTGLKTNLQTANGSTALPSNAYQFGGFTAGSSRNESVTPSNSSYDYIKDKSTGKAITGWRIFDIDGDNVTLISAGNPEDYNHQLANGAGEISQYILTGEGSLSSSQAANYQKRDWGVYVNKTQKATNAMPLTSTRLSQWNKKYIDSSSYSSFNDMFNKIKNQYTNYQNIIDNNSFYWLCSGYEGHLSNVGSGSYNNTSYNGQHGIRMLVTLSSSALFKEERTGTKTLTGGNMDKYGGNKTYNCWSIATTDTSNSVAASKIESTSSKKQTLDLGEVDFINPAFIYEYANTTIDHDKKKVTVIFDVTDKFFNTSALTSDTTASKITVNFEGKEATKATKALSKLSDITETVNGTSKKVGEKYQLIVSDLDQGNGGDYSGIMTLVFPAEIATDTSDNKSVAKTITIGVDDPKVNDSSDGPYLPTGFTHVSGTSLDNGYTVQDSNGNQYVWVEVPKTTDVYKTAGLKITKFTSDEYTKIENDLHTYTSVYRENGYTDEWGSQDETGMTSDQYTELKQKMLKSVYKHGGFYIGKYETGSESTGPVIKQNAAPYGNVTSSQSQKLASGFSSDLNGYASSLLFGVQWDLVLKYLETKGATQSELNKDSISWGNYYKSTWNVTNTSSKYSRNGGGAWSIGAYGQKSSNTAVLLSTGASDTFSKQGIYDLAGNMEEWTLENASRGSVLRGGEYDVNATYSAAYHYSATSSTESYDFYGFRVALYKDSDSDTSGSNDPVIVDVVDPVWKVENINIDKTNQKVTADLIATDKYLTGVENSTLTTDDITLTIDGETNTAITKTLSEPTFSENAETGLKEIKYTLTLDDWVESTRQAGKSFLEYSGSAKITIKAGTVTDSAGKTNDSTGVKPSEIFDQVGLKDGLHIGDFVDYDAGTWTQKEINSIQTGTTGSLQTPNGSTDLPTKGYQFGGFTAGSSRNSNATPSVNSLNYIKDLSTNSAVTGWRIFDIDGDNVTLISAGTPEDYYYDYENDNDAYANEYILTGNVNSYWSTSEAEKYKKRNWNMYVNGTQKGISAIPLTKERLDNWYTKYTYTTNADTYTTSTFQKIYGTSYIKYQNVIDNYSNVWLSSAYDSSKLFAFSPYPRMVSKSAISAEGIRMLVNLSSDVLFSSQKTGTKTLTGGNMDTYGGNQTYNCWKIEEEMKSDGKTNSSKEQTFELGQVDFIQPTYIYEYTNTIIDHDKKKVTVVFDITDKYFNTSALSSDTTASKITVKFEGKEATNATKALSKLSDITATVNGTSKKVGEKYQLIVSDLDQGNGGDYSGIMTLGFPKGAVTDSSDNQSIAKTITIGVDEPNSSKAARPSELFDQDGTNSNKLHIGDFVNYDAGTWTQDEISSIKTGLKTNLQTANGSTNIPSNGYQFGGFTAGLSRNGNATPNYDSYEYLTDSSTGSSVTGWRIFSVDGDNVTLISAGNPEDYYHPKTDESGIASEYILTGDVDSEWNVNVAEKYNARDWSMYINKNQKAVSAKPLTFSEMNGWYRKYIDSNSNIWYPASVQKVYEEPYLKYQNVIDNASCYYLATNYRDNEIFGFFPNVRIVRYNSDIARGIRMLVTLSSDVLLSSEKTGTKTLTGGNMDSYGGNQTYNCWDIVTETNQDSVIVDVVDPVWKVENINIDKTNKKVTADLIATDKYLTGVENSTLTTDDITLTIDGETNTVITKTLSAPTFSENASTGLKEIKYTLTLDNWEESVRQAGKSFLEYSGSAKIIIKAGTVTDSAGGSSVVKPSELFDQDGSNTNGLHIGDFVDYDAGTWTQDEINSIQTGLKTDLKTANGTTALPTSEYQFGGFETGSSRNENATFYYHEGYCDYIKDATTNTAITGWRVFDIDGDSTTLITAGNPEDYFHEHPKGTDGTPAYESEYVLTGNVNSGWSTGTSSKTKYQIRDWSMYVNEEQKATSAIPLTNSSLEDWCNKYMGGFQGDSTIEKLYQEPYIRYQNILDNYSYYWLGSASGLGMLADFEPDYRGYVNGSTGRALGIRMLVTLSSDVQFNSTKTGTKTLTGGNMNTYGGNQTYNCWSIATGSNGNANGENNSSKEQTLDLGQVDFINPEFTYKYSNTTIDHDKKKVTVIFDIADKCFNTSALTTDSTASNITVKFEGKEATNATKELSKLSDITATINGTSKKVGEKYQLVVSNLDQGNGGDYSGIMTLVFPAGIVTDTSSNNSLTKTITIGVDEDGSSIKGAKPSELFDSTGSDTNKLHIGDFINYDAGTWTQEEINSIQTGLKTNLQTANGSTESPTSFLQFGGFTAGSSRNGNATPNSINYIKDKTTGTTVTGWRVFDIDGDSITLISAGNPEKYKPTYGTTDGGVINQYILTGDGSYGNWTTSSPNDYQIRDWGVYVNEEQKATSARAFDEDYLNSWYSKYINNSNSSKDFEVLYKEPYLKYQNIIDNNSIYWLCMHSYGNPENMIYVCRNPSNLVSDGNNYSASGVRVLVTLSSDVLLSSKKIGTKTLTGGNMDTYGGEQTYNCWDIVAATEGESGSKDPVIVDVVDPVWKVENVKQDTENQKVTLDLVATDKYLTGVENSTLTADDITISVDGDENANNVIKKTLSEPTFSGDGPYIPTGYSHVAGTSLDNGFTVQDSKGNQFVWVEVPKTADVYPTAGLKITEFTTDAYTKIENDLHTYTSVYR